MANLFDQIEREIFSGLPNERKRIDDALFNLESYRADFKRCPPRLSENDDERLDRTLPIMRRIVHVLTKNLYGEGPRRTLQPPEGSDQATYEAVDQWLNAVYRRNAIDAMFQEADRMATVGDFCAFQVKPSTNPKEPVRVTLWKANELVVWLNPEDQTEPIAVGTIDMFDNQRRLTLWTAGFYQVYMTEKWTPGTGNGATVYRRVGPAVPHPFGIIPFSFVHFEFPTSYFYTDGPGTNLRELNDRVNLSISEVFRAVMANLKAILVAKNIPAGTTLPKPIRPGVVVELAGPKEGSETETDPSLDYLQADSSFVAAGWDDAERFLSLTLDMHGVPESAVRMVQDSSRSGVSLVTEQIPLIDWAVSRQRAFSRYEDDLAKVVLTVGASHLGQQDFDEYKATSAQLALVANEPNLTLRWPNMYPRLPGEETDRGDQFKLDNQFRSRTQLLMEREGMTREEAVAYREETAQDLKDEEALFGSTEPEPEEGNEPDESTQFDMNDSTDDSEGNDNG